MALKSARAKLSTTVSRETYHYLNELVESGRVRNLAEAVDEVVEEMRKTENRRRLARATSEYYGSFSANEIAEESSLTDAMSSAASKVDFDREP